MAIIGGGTTLARPTKSVEEIARLSELNDSDCLKAVREGGRALRLETLAYLVRTGLRAGDNELTEAAASHLLVESRSIATSVLGILPESDWDDARAEVIRDMLVDLEASTADDVTFWEERFGFVYKKRCIDAVRRRRTKGALATISVDGLPEDPRPPDPADVAEEAIARLDRVAIQSILRALSPEQSRAVTLAWLQELPVQGPGSVSEIMDVSPSMVHRHLRTARAVLQSDPRLRALLELE